MTSISEPTITHPAWCDPARCDVERISGVPTGDVYHLSKLTELAEPFGIDVSLCRVDRDGQVFAPSRIYLYTGGHDGALTPDQLEAAGRWLIERAAEHLEAIEGPEAALAASKRHAADAVRPFMPGLARELDAEGGAR